VNPEASGFLSGKIAGIPVIAVVGGIALVAYFLFFRNSQAGAASASGGSGSITSGTTTLQKGAIQVHVTQDGGTPEQNPQPKPPVTPRTTTRSITVGRDQTLAQLAKAYHWTPETLKAVENQNELGGKGILKPTTKLHKGQVIIRPLK
jgi:hypothetical protein